MDNDDIKERFYKLSLLDKYNALDRAETSARYMALRCFLFTGNIDLATRFYLGCVIIPLKKIRIA